MPYVVNNTRGQIIAVIADGTINTSATSQTLVGKNVTPYGEYEVENLVHQLENFADSVAPGNPIEGQLWYNTIEEKMYAYSGEEFKPVSGLTVSTSAPALDPRQGDLWFDPTTQQVKVYSPVTSGLAWVPVSKVTVATSSPTAVAAGELYFNSVTKQLFASDGTTWNLIGPEGVSGFGVTRWISTTLLDTGSVARAVILGQVNGVTQAIVSSDTFTILETARPIGFVNLLPGINLAATSIINGRVVSADQLTTARAINGVLFDGTANVIVPNNGELVAGDYLVGTAYSGTVPQTWRVDATPLGTASKVVARDALGDFTARVITADLIGTVTGTATNVTGLVLPAQGGTGQSTYNPGDILLGKANGQLGRGKVFGSEFISVSDTDGNITINYTGGTGNGTVTSVGITTVGDGIGISGSPITSNGAITITNTGVTRLNAGSGISTNAVNGNVTVTNSGVTRLIAGTNVTLSADTGNITISASPGISGVAAIVAGTGITVNPPSGTGSVTVSNNGVTRLVAGSGVSLSAETGTVTITATGGTTSGLVTTNTTQTITGQKTFTGGVISQTYNYLPQGVSTYYATNNSANSWILSVDPAQSLNGISTIASATNSQIRDGTTIGNGRPFLYVTALSGSGNYFETVNAGWNSDWIRWAWTGNPNGSTANVPGIGSSVGPFRPNGQPLGFALLPSNGGVSYLGGPNNPWHSIYLTNVPVISDRRRKLDIQDTQLGLDFITRLRPVQYRVAGTVSPTANITADPTVPMSAPAASVPDGQRTHHGLIAQEVKQALDELGVGDRFSGWQMVDKGDADSLQQLNYLEFIAPLIRAVQELEQQVQDLRDQLDER